MGAKRVDAGRRGRPGVVSARRRGDSRRPFYVVLALIALAGTAAILYVATRPEQGVATIDPTLPPGEAKGYLLGDSAAPVRILEFADFQCPACESFSTITEPDVRERIVNAGLASFRFYDFPLPQHRNAVNASLAAACANDQGKFWEYHDRLFAGQPDWSEQRNPQGIYAGYARELGLDVERWEECYEARTHERTILANKAEGERLGVSQTPTFVIGSRKVAGAIGYDRLRALVDSATADARASGAAARTSAPAAPAPPADGPGR
jgi:protein-disulfide isomerase